MTSAASVGILSDVRRVGLIFLLVSFVAMSSGLMGFLHHIEHSAGNRSELSGRSWTAAPDGVGHDEANCAVCMVLHAPLASAGYVPILVSLGLFVAFLTLLSGSLTSLRLPLTVECRGPPSS